MNGVAIAKPVPPKIASTPHTIKKIADGVAFQVPPTIDDPLILDEITADLSTLGYPAVSCSA